MFSFLLLLRYPFALDFQAEARAHYNCPTMDGMDLENDGGSGTAFVHFEKRITEVNYP